MAQQPAFEAYGTAKGTLKPGQTIKVNEHAVQVERYLSQGGFAHVYLVQTATPVYNTTQHVLKRIAVSNQTVLSEVKKEVDIMRILRGHPNIVQFIDAAWHELSNGTYEVFILMEFCPGGGIINMMNRRLRERLTEAEILQIFVDVCEGVAAMHNLRPPLLHRDLKVENILQTSSTSYKLCDFGSAAPVASRVPNTNAEIRALENDLNQHTTLPYRAPEMVDLYLRRPIDEKSDVWALGVLLYKLCYYTTPFEEHGPLAILNVQYRIPPYPVYSQNINALIASMLRELGPQRPSVFEILNVVHTMRGTKSRFAYTIPQQLLSPRRAVASPISTNASGTLDGIVTLRSDAPPEKNAGVQAREAVLEAIAPMRRGRPTQTAVAHNGRMPSPPVSSQFRPSSPQKGSKTRNWLEDEHVETQEPRGRKTELLDFDSPLANSSADPWKVRSAPSHRESQKASQTPDGLKRVPSRGPKGFENDFAEKLWSSYESKSPLIPTNTPALSVSPAVSLPKMPTSLLTQSRVVPTVSSGKDAFDGLGLSPSAPPPTLGEARKTRTGLASMHPYSSYQSLSPRPPSSQPGPSPQPSPIAPSTSPAWKRPSITPAVGEYRAETRFPSLEELDAQFAGTSSSLSTMPNHANSQPSKELSKAGTTGSGDLHPPLPERRPTYGDGVRSQQVTGIAMRESLDFKRPVLPIRGQANEPSLPERKSRPGDLLPKPTLVRKHRSSTSIKQYPNGDNAPASAEPVSPKKSTSKSQRDWLTGDDTGENGTAEQPPPRGVPVLRQSPSKRASYIERSNMDELRTADAVAQTVVVETEPTSPSSPESPPEPAEPVGRGRRSIIMPTATRPIPSMDNMVNEASKLTNSYPTTRPGNREFVPAPPVDKDSSSSAEEGPEDVNGAIRDSEIRRRKGKGRQSSVHELVDLWGGGIIGSAPKDQDSPRDKISMPQQDDKNVLQSIQNGKVGSGSDLVKRRQTVLGAPSTVRQRTSASNEQPGPPATNSTLRPGPSPHRKQPSTNDGVSYPPPSPTSSRSPGRSRPQSLFIFPVVKSNSDVSSVEGPYLGLVAPQDQKLKSSRRNSISEIVEKFEGVRMAGNIGVAANQDNDGPPAAPKLTPLKSSFPGSAAAPVATVASVLTKPEPSVQAYKAARRASSFLPAPEHMPSAFKGPAQKRISPGVPSMTSQALTQTQSSENLTGAPQRSTTAYRLRSESSEAVNPSVPNGSSTNRNEDLSNPRPSSPEKPYQGVGRLIDQWQRKAAGTEASSGPSLKRGSYIAKRGGNSP